MIRLATTEDAPALVLLGYAFYEDARPEQRLAVASLDGLEALVTLALEQGVVVVAELEGVLVGMLAGIIMPHPISLEPMAEEIAWFVMPEHRNGLIGPKMLRSFEEWARQNGAAVLKMVAPIGSDVGRYYTRCGYLPIETAYLKQL